MSKRFISGVIKKTFLLVATLFSLLGGSAMAEEKMCADLKKVNNLDEMLYQFYVNLDSDCLFTMPLAELEKAWGIKIMSRDRLQTNQKLFELRSSADFRGKPYHSEADAFFVEAYRKDSITLTFTIYMTKAYDKAHATLFPEGNYPRLLPEPIKKINRNPPSYRPLPLDDVPHLPKNPGKYRSDYLYFWLNADRTHVINISPGPTPSVGGISVYYEIPSGYLEYFNE